MTDPRPRPQYGEYATPEQMAKAMGQPAPTSETQGDVAASASSPSPAAPPAATPYPAAPYEASGTKATAPRTRRTWDVVLTMVLLGFGVVSVTSSIPQYANFAETMRTVTAQMGYGEYTATALADNVGIAINAVQIVLFAATAVVSILLVRRNRLAFYVPLIGAALFFIVFIALIIVAFTGDPGLMSQLTSGTLPTEGSSA